MNDSSKRRLPVTPQLPENLTARAAYLAAQAYNELVMGMLMGALNVHEFLERDRVLRPRAEELLARLAGAATELQPAGVLAGWDARHTAPGSAGFEPTELEKCQQVLVRHLLEAESLRRAFLQIQDMLSLDSRPQEFACFVARQLSTTQQFIGPDELIEATAYLIALRCILQERIGTLVDVARSPPASNQALTD